jgi:hypothetical protein
MLVFGRERGSSENAVVDGRIILKSTFRKLRGGGGEFTGLMWLRI